MLAPFLRNSDADFVWAQAVQTFSCLGTFFDAFKLTSQTLWFSNLQGLQMLYRPVGLLLFM
jgi:hypothetical protein